jgi:hypothetical protein
LVCLILGPSVKRDAFSILGVTLHVAVNEQQEFPKFQDQMRVFQKVLSSSVLVDACCQSAVCDSDELNLAALGVPDGLGHYIVNRGAPLAPAGAEALFAAFYTIKREFVHFVLNNRCRKRHL